MNIIELSNILNPYNQLIFDCFDATRVFSWILYEHNIPHTTMSGRLELDGEIIEPHYWIELDDTGWLIDFKASLLIGNGNKVPHGVFDQRVYPRALYIGIPIRMLVYKTLFDHLMSDENKE